MRASAAVRIGCHVYVLAASSTETKACEGAVVPTDATNDRQSFVLNGLLSCRTLPESLSRLPLLDEMCVVHSLRGSMNQE